MDLEELKENLKSITIHDLDQAHLLTEDNKGGVIMCHTPDYYNEQRNEVCCIAAANTEEMSLVIIANGMLLDAKGKKETGREAEVGRVYIDEFKASMILDALYHAFPELIYEIIEKEDNIEDDIDDETEEEKNAIDLLTSFPKPEDYELVSIDLINKASTLNEVIGNLKIASKNLEEFKDNNFELLCRPAENLIALSSNKNDKQTLDPEQLIDLHNKIKEQLGDGTKAITNENRTIYVSPNDNKTVKISECDLQKLINQKLDFAPDLTKYLNSINVSMDTFKKLVPIARALLKKQITEGDIHD